MEKKGRKQGEIPENLINLAKKGHETVDELCN